MIETQFKQETLKSLENKIIKLEDSDKDRIYNFVKKELNIPMPKEIESYVNNISQYRKQLSDLRDFFESANKIKRMTDAKGQVVSYEDVSNFASNRGYIIERMNKYVESIPISILNHISKLHLYNHDVYIIAPKEHFSQEPVIDYDPYLFITEERVIPDKYDFRPKSHKRNPATIPCIVECSWDEKNQVIPLTQNLN